MQLHSSLVLRIRNIPRPEEDGRTLVRAACGAGDEEIRRCDRMRAPELAPAKPRRPKGLG
jgi:hypothetical protein